MFSTSTGNLWHFLGKLLPVLVLYRCCTPGASAPVAVKNQSSEVVQEPLPLKPGILVLKSVVLVKRKNGFTKTIPWAGNPGKIRTRAF